MKLNAYKILIGILIFGFLIVLPSAFAEDCNHNGIDDFQDTAPIHNQYVNILQNTTFNYPTGSKIVDIDNDGDQDIVLGVRTPSPAIGILLNDGQGNFTSGASFPVTPLPNGYTPVASVGYIEVADLNNDGYKDVITTIKVSGQRFSYGVVFINNGAGGFQNPYFFNEVITYPYTDSPSTGIVADFNGDQNKDLAIVTQDGLISIYINNGTNGGNWQGFQSQRDTYFAGSLLYGLIALDIDHDGDLDLATIRDGSTVTFLQNNGQGIFAPGGIYSTGTLSGASGLLTADLNGDNRSDLIFITSRGINVGIDNSNGQHGVISFAPRISVDPTEFFHDPLIGSVLVNVQDIDLDGRPDFIVADYQSQDMLFLFNRSFNANQTFTLDLVRAHEPSLAGDVTGRLSLGSMSDLNNDGTVDFVASSAVGGVPRLWLLTNNNIWSAPTQFSQDANGNRIPDECEFPSLMANWPQYIGAAGSILAVGNLDSDPEPEFVVQAENGWVHAWNSNGTYVPGWPQFTTSYNGVTNPPVIADLNGDGINEVIYTAWTRLYVKNSNGTNFDGNGNGTPDWPVTIPPNGIGSPLIVDLDPNYPGLEIVLLCTNNTVLAYHADGTPVSGWPVPFGGAINGSNLAAADLDPASPGLEIIVGGRDGHVYAFHRNGSPVSGWPVNLANASDITRDIAVGSFNGNNTMNVVASSYTGVYAWNNNGAPAVGWPKQITSGAVGAPVLADLDPTYPGLEVVAAGGDRKIYMWHSDGSSVSGWPVTLPQTVSNCCVLADLDGDEMVDIIAVADDRKVYGLHSNGLPVTGFPFLTSQLATPMLPVVADLNHDNKLEIIFSQFSNNTGRVLVWTMPNSVFDTNPWPMYQKDIRHSGLYLPPDHPPVLNPIGNRNVNINAQLQFSINATDPDANDALTLTADNMPSGATFVDNHNGTGIFSWTPIYNQAGDYSVTFTVRDSFGATDYEVVLIHVNNVIILPHTGPLQTATAVPDPEP